MLRLGSIGRTTIDVDASFFILVTLFVVLSYNPQQGIHYALLWAPVLFLSVLIHELAHAGMIAALGFGASQIILGGMGGVTINERRARPWQDFLISAVGPASSFALWIVSDIIYRSGSVSDLFLFNLLRYMASANFFWGIFNSIPVPPLDGGHATRSFFRMFLAERPAFVIAVWIAMVGGTIAAVAAAYSGSFFIALFVAWFTWQSYQAWVYFREHGVPGD